MNFRFTTFGGKCGRPGRFTSDAQRKACFFNLFSGGSKSAIRFTEPDYLKGNKDYVPIKVDVGKFDEYWARNPENYFEKESVGLKDRYECVVEAIKDKKEIDMPEVYAKPKEDAVKVADGRHRLAAIRDLGFKQEEILVPKFQKKWFEENVGVKGGQHSRCCTS